jgi:small subunit ribosomal protein S6
MPTYETLYITQPEMAEADAEALGKSFEELVETGEGTLMKSVAWGKRKLAYLVKKHQEGLYFYMQFDVAPDVVAELERRLRNHEEVLKFLSVRLDRTALETLAAADKKAEERAAARAQREAERAERQKLAEEESAAAQAKADEAAAAKKPSPDAATAAPVTAEDPTPGEETSSDAATAESSAESENEPKSDDE